VRRDDIARAIGDDEVGGVRVGLDLAAQRRPLGTRRRARRHEGRGLRGIDRAGLFAPIRFREELLERGRCDVRIARVAKPYPESVFGRFGEAVQILDAVVSKRRVIEPAHDAEADQIIERVCGRRGRHDVHSTVADRDGRPPFGAIGQKIREREESIRLFHRSINRPRDCAGVEDARAFVGDHLQRARKIGLLQNGAGRERLSVVAVASMAHTAADTTIDR
jgi:hypothetical protein